MTKQELEANIDVNLATTETIVTTYAGEAAKGYISAALLSGVTLAGGFLTIHENVKKSLTMKTLAISNILGNRTKTFSAAGSINVGERVLTPKELEVNIELDKSKYRADWDAMEMSASAHDVLPKTFEDHLINQVSAFVAEAVEISLWQGDKANAGEFDGFITRLKADSDLPASQKITGTTITTDVVIDEMQKVVDAIPDTLFNVDGVNLYVAQNVGKAYITTLGGFQAQGKGSNGIGGAGTMWYNKQNLSFGGYNLVIVNGLPAGHMVVGEKSKMAFATSLISDQNLVKVLDMSNVTGDDVVRVIMNFTGDTNYAVSEEMVYYGITA